MSDRFVDWEVTVVRAAAEEMLFWQYHLPSALLSQWMAEWVHQHRHHIRQRTPAASVNTESFA